MDERDLVLKLTNDFAFGWTGFEMGLAEYHRGNTAQQLKIKLMMIDNITWQILQGTASSKARYYGSDAAVISPEHLHQSVDRVAMRLGHNANTPPRVAPQVSPQVSSSHQSPQHQARPMFSSTQNCLCGGVLVKQISYAKGQYALCTSCGNMSSKLEPNSTATISPPRQYAQAPNPPAYTPGYIEHATSNPVYTPAHSAPEVQAAANVKPYIQPMQIAPTTPRRFEVRTPTDRSGTPPAPEDVVPSNDPVFEVRQVPASRYKKKTDPKNKPKPRADSSPLRSVQENRSKFDFKSSKKQEDEEEMEVGRHPSSSSPVDKRPFGEGWGREDGQWKQWAEMQNRGGRAEISSMGSQRVEPVPRREESAPTPPVPAPAPAPPVPVLVSRQESARSQRSQRERGRRESDVSLVAVNVAPSAASSTTQAPSVASFVQPPPSPAPSQRSEAAPTEQCTIEVRSLDGKSMTLTSLPTTLPVREIKIKIQNAWGGDLTYMRIVHNGKSWDDAQTLTDMGLSTGGVVHVVMPPT
eukprot:TRINITY_DN6003_c0_g1_i3.p1 TRINITY_DN6003_c0_g1~~TRINITY_DN6003_c0_g1_i3.p1  ORF type:complete len:549 (+),score=71.30 TRINITY_DN6003_c0_g1_i3:78-1649(+)